MKTKILITLFFVLCPLVVFSEEEPKKLCVAVMVSDDHYNADTLLPPMMERLAKENHWEIVVLHGKGTSTFSNISALDRADVLVVYIRRMALPKAQLDAVRKFVASGRGVVGLRTASHAFHLRNAESKEGFDQWKEFDNEVLGGSYNDHGKNELGTDVRNVPSQKNSVQKDSAILKDVVPEQWHSEGSLYFVEPVNKDATVYQLGSSVEKQDMPLTWTRTYNNSGKNSDKKTRVAYTSLGHQKDFEQKPFQMLVRNLVNWAGEK